MSARSDLGIVVMLAAETEDLDDKERAALQRVALRLDLDYGKFTVTNQDRHGPHFAPHVGTDCLTSGQLEQFRRLCDKWMPCDYCGLPVGEHGTDVNGARCPAVPIGEVS